MATTRTTSTLAGLAATTRAPRRRPGAAGTTSAPAHRARGVTTEHEEYEEYEEEGYAAAKARQQEPDALEAAFPLESYRPGSDRGPADLDGDPRRDRPHLPRRPRAAS